MGVKWVYFDLARRLPGDDDWLPEPVIRDFRDGVHNQMHLLPVGQRWVDGIPAYESATSMQPHFSTSQ